DGVSVEEAEVLVGDRVGETPLLVGEGSRQVDYGNESFLDGQPYLKVVGGLHDLSLEARGGILRPGPEVACAEVELVVEEPEAGLAEDAHDGRRAVIALRRRRRGGEIGEILRRVLAAHAVVGAVE